MSSARVDYIAPWWTYWLHNFPHINLRLQPIDNSFKPEDESYQQSLIFLGCVAAAGLGLNLLFLAIYLSCLCCARRDDEDPGDTKKKGSCCVTWSAVTAGLISCASLSPGLLEEGSGNVTQMNPGDSSSQGMLVLTSMAVGVGFYGNSETNDGVYQLTYSMYNANHTLEGVDSLVSTTMGSMQRGLQQHLARLDEIFATRGDYVQTLQFMQQMADSVIKQLLGLPDWMEAEVDLASLADKTADIEYYRWLTYLLVLILNLVICLLSCLGLVKQSRWLLTTMMVCGVLTLILSWASLGADLATAVGTSDFCVAPDRYLMSQTKGISAEILHYYVYCNQTLSNPFQKSLTVFQRSLTTMQIQIQGLLQFAVPLFPSAEGDLQGIQNLLNSSEASLHQLTALLDCRGLNKDYLDALVGVCYDGVEGLLYLSLFSMLAACSFCIMLCAIPRAWRQIAARERDYDDMDDEDPFNPRARRAGHAPNPAHPNMHSFCSYSSSMGSQSSLHPPAPPSALSNAPVAPDYMNQAALFGGNPRYENVPLIGRGSPPPSYSPSMRATYLSMTEEQSRHFGNDFRA